MTQSRSLGTSDRLSVATFLNLNRLSMRPLTERHGRSLIPLTLSLPLSRPLGFTHLCRGFPARSIRFIETRSALAFSRCYPRSFTFYLGKPISSIQATGTRVAASMGGVSALSVISLRRNGISTTSAIRPRGCRRQAPRRASHTRHWWRSP
jgi:hypothetical protein